MLCRIKNGNQGIFTFSEVDHFSPKEQIPDFFRTKLICVGVGSGLGLGLGLELVSQVVFWAFFEISLLITPERHVGYTKFPDFYTSSEIIIHSSGKGVSDNE